jgi:hypothetical protein
MTFYLSFPDVDGLPSALLPALVGLRGGLRDALRYEATRSEIDKIDSQAGRLRLCCEVGARSRHQPDRHFLYLARSPSTLDEILGSERSDPTLLGRLFGYPSCCVSAFAQRMGHARSEGEPNFPLLAFRNSRGQLYPELNNLLWYMNDERTPYYLISHFPCSYSCTWSLDTARKLRRLLRKECPELVDRMDQYLALPVLLFDDHTSDHWDENNGFVFDGTSEGCWIRYGDFHPLRTHRDDTPFRVGDRLANREDRIDVFKGDTPVGSVKKGRLLEAVILPFDRARRASP